LCLFGDLDIQTYDEVPSTVSLYVTIGSDSTISIFVNSFLKSLMQISTCNSPHPAIMCSPVSSVVTTTNGSDLANFLRPSTNFGKS
jgi:hypothetical protein